MKQHPTPLRLAAGLLLASTALPLSPLLAQDQPATDPAAQSPAPSDVATPPPAAPAEVSPTPPAEVPAVASPTSGGVQASEPVVNTRASGNEPADASVAGAAAAERRPAARQRTATRSAAPAPRARTAAPPPAPVAAAPDPAPAATPAPIAAAPAPAPAAEAPAPAADTAAADPAPAAEPAQGGTGFWPWLIAAALAIGALLLFARRRRRRDDYDHVAYEEPVAIHEHEPVAAPIIHDEPVHEPIAIHEPVAGPVAAAAAAVPETGGKPWLELMMRPRRAGVGEDAARVEFELDVANTGSAPAHDVRISTWLFDGNSPAQSEMERTLIERPGAAEATESVLTPGETTRMQAQVAVPRAGLEDAIMPVVVADARYRKPDGSEGRIAASFKIGVPIGEDLAVFDVENPSGMHEGVEARLYGEPTRD